MPPEDIVLTKPVIATPFDSTFTTATLDRRSLS
jgi:hypothetical protein